MLGGAVRQRACPASRPLSSTAKANAAASTVASTHVAAKWTACIPWENDNRVARKFCNLLGNDVYDKRDFICEGSSIHADGENDPQYALSKPRPDTMLAAWKNWRSTKATDSRTDAQGRTRARNNALWTVLAVLMMESINEEKTSLYKKKRLPYDCIHRKILHIHHWHRRFSACFLLHCLRTAGK